MAVMTHAVHADAAPWTVTVEGGAEADSNVQRVETGPSLETSPIAAPVMRLGGRLGNKGRVLDGSYALNLSTRARFVAGDYAISPENIVLLTGDARWLHAVGQRPLSVGVALTAADALPISDAIGARTFRNLGADALLVLRDGDDRSLTLAAGGRDFTFKPNTEFNWTGPTATLRLDLVLWQPAARTKSLELSSILGIDLRSYRGVAFADACPMDAPSDPSCFAPTSLGRRDRYHRVGLELTWTGEIVVAGGYQLVVIDSNSFGQSLVRHRGQVSVTTALPFDVYASLLGIVQIDQFLDGLVVQTDPNQQQFTNLDDENRSSLQLRLGRPISSGWSVEGRAAIWRNLGNSDNTFHRELVYGGLIYTR